MTHIYRLPSCRISSLQQRPCQSCMFANGVHDAVQVVRAGMHVSAAFLNNSSSRWEAIWDAWDFKAELVDHVSPIYRSDFLRCACDA